MTLPNFHEIFRVSGYALSGYQDHFMEEKQQKLWHKATKAEKARENKKRMCLFEVNPES